MVKSKENDIEKDKAIKDGKKKWGLKLLNKMKE